jgi:hypothetical protein
LLDPDAVNLLGGKLIDLILPVSCSVSRNVKVAISDILRQPAATGDNFPRASPLLDDEIAGGACPSWPTAVFRGVE